MDALVNDLRFAARTLLRSPGLTAVAVLSLALGIGANTTIFSLADALLLRPLAVPEPKRMVTLQRGAGQGSPCSYPDYLDYRDRAAELVQLAAHTIAPVSLSRGGQSVMALAELVSGNYFSVLGVAVAHGRSITPEDDGAPGAHPVLVVGHRFWRQRLGADPQVVGRTVTLNGRAFTVVGVAPAGFQGASTPITPDLWLPVAMQSEAMPQTPGLIRARDAEWFGVVGRLRPGVTVEQVRASLHAVDRQLRREHPDTFGNPIRAGERTLHLLPLRGIYAAHLRRLATMATALLAAVVGLVLLIACANVSHLLLARATTRRREMAVRLALGAGRRRLIRQLLTESVLLAGLGTLGALLLASWTTDLLAGLQPPLPPPFTFAPDLRLDARVLVFTALLALVTAAVFGLAPALQASRPDLVPALKEEAAALSAGRGARRLRAALVVSQVALCLVVLAAAGLFLRSLRAAEAIDPGFRTEHALVLALDLQLQGYDETRGRALQRRLRERVLALPGVESAALAGSLPLGFVQRMTLAAAEGREVPPGQPPDALGATEVDDGYFRAMGTAVLGGREFSPRDTAQSTPVVVVSEALARRFWPGQAALGRRLRLGGEDAPWREVVGVVRDTKRMTLGEEPRPVAYLPLAQEYASSVSLVVRTAGDPARLIPALRREVQALDPDLPMQGLRTMGEHVALSMWPARMGAGVVGAFALLALCLAAVGIYGVVAYSVAARTREIGLRMALGAGRADVLRLVLGEALRLAGLGAALGLAAALALGRLLVGLLYGVRPGDPGTFAAVAAVLALVTVAAGLVPARRAARVDPMDALRYE